MKKTKEIYDLIAELAQLTNFEKQAILLTTTVKQNVNNELVKQLTKDVYVGIKKILLQCQLALPTKIYSNIKWNKKTTSALEPLFALLFSELGFDQLSLLRDMLSKKDLMQLLLMGEELEMIEILNDYGKIFKRVAKNMESLANIQTTLSENEDMLDKKSELGSYKMVLKPEILPMDKLEKKTEETDRDKEWWY